MSAELHHLLGPSSLARRIACPASLLMEKNLPALPSTEDASEGTRLHRACETGDLTGLDAEQLELVEKCLAFSAEVCGSAKFQREVKLRLIGPGGEVLTFGTADVVHVAGKDGTLVDYKFGRNEVPEAADNPQLAAYAAMLMQRYGLETVQVWVFQPRLGHRSSALYRAGHDRTFADFLLGVRSECLRADAPFHAGDCCRYCKGAAYCVCPELHREMQTLAKNPPDTEELAKKASGEMLTRFVLAAEQVVKAYGYAKEELRARARQNGGTYHQWVLTPGRKTRSCTQLESLHKLLSGVIGTGDFLQCCTVSVASLETLYADRMKSAGKAKTLAAGKKLFGELTGPVLTLKVGDGTLKYVEPIDVNVEAELSASEVQYNTKKEEE